MNLFEVEEGPENTSPDDYWDIVHSKERHGLDSPYHVIEVEVIPEDEHGSEEREYTLLHPEKCSDKADCEFVDFEPDAHGFVDDTEYPAGRYFIEMKFSQDYWGEWDSEIVDHGPVHALTP